MITSLDHVTEFPLCWPETKPRVAHRVNAPFYGTTLAKSLREIDDEMRRYKALRYIVSMAPAYRRTMSDPAVAVWFEIGKGDDLPQLRVIACDKYGHPEENAHAVALTLQGLRAFERYGTYTQDQALEGARLSLPPPDGQSQIDWRAVFACSKIGDLAASDQLAIVNARYRRMAVDANGSDDELRRLNLAIEKARQELGA